MELLARYDCSPTLATPGMVVAMHPEFIRDLRAAGVELAIHGFDHVDFRSLTQADAHRQFARAASAYTDAGIPFTGFRCPYLSYSHDMSALVPDGLVGYSSNEAVWWDVVSDDGERTVIFDSLADFYRATPAAESLVLPRAVDGFVEIPVSLPDDLQLLDGLGAGDAGVRDAWLRSCAKATIAAPCSSSSSIRNRSISAPAPSKDCSQGPFPRTGGVDRPLGEIADWWRSSGTFRPASRGPPSSSSARSGPWCSRAAERGTGPDTVARRLPGRQSWHSLHDAEVPFVGAPHPGCAASATALRELGYSSSTARRPGLRCSPRPARRRGRVTDLSSSTRRARRRPLVRFWHWPAGVMSALCITGDLDALSLLDYASTPRRSVNPAPAPTQTITHKSRCAIGS